MSQTENNEFLISTFHSDGGPPRSGNFELLSQPCEIKIGYIEQDKIEADVVLHAPNREVFDADECRFMYFLDGVWELADPMNA